MHRSSLKSLLISAVFIAMMTAPSAATSHVYVYERADGSKLISDQKQAPGEYRLIKTYITKPKGSRPANAPYLARPIASQFDALIVNTALQFDLEPAFIKAVVHVESAFDRFAVSHAGAMGLMQLMPDTAKRYQFTNNYFDAQRNMAVGVQHMKELMDRYQNDKRLSLAAYNAGEGAVAKYKGVPPFQETQSYITKVLRLYALYVQSFTGQSG